MPTVHDIEQALFQWAPRETAMQWDNVGHLIGIPSQLVQRILIALDITEDVVREAMEGNFDLIVSHHPVMNCAWSPVQRIQDDHLTALRCEVLHRSLEWAYTSGTDDRHLVLHVRAMDCTVLGGFVRQR